MFALRFAKSAARGLARMPQGIARRMLCELKTIAAAYRGDWKPLQGPPARARYRGGGRPSSSGRRTSNATSSGCSAVQAGPMRVKAGKARTAPCRLSGWEKNWRVIVLRRLRRNEMLIAQDDDGQGLLGFVEAKKKAGKPTRAHRAMLPRPPPVPRPARYHPGRPGGQAWLAGCSRP